MRINMKKMIGIACLSMIMSASAVAYNASDAIDYSDKYALNRNDLIIAGGYNSYSNDCTNFVSQCLEAGGLEQDDEWYSRVSSTGIVSSVRKDSRTWTVADDLKEYLKNNVATKIGSWSRNGVDGTNKYVDNSSNLTSSNEGKTVLFYDWDSDGQMNHAAFFVKNNSKSLDSDDNGARGDLINQHSGDRKRAIWHGDERNTHRKTTRIYAFELD